MAITVQDCPGVRTWPFTQVPPANWKLSCVGVIVNPGAPTVRFPVPTFDRVVVWLGAQLAGLVMAVAANDKDAGETWPIFVGELPVHPPACPVNPFGTQGSSTWRWLAQSIADGLKGYEELAPIIAMPAALATPTTGEVAPYTE